MKVSLSEEQEVTLACVYEKTEFAMERIEVLLEHPPKTLLCLIRSKQTYKDKLLKLKATLSNFQRVLAVREEQHNLDKTFKLDKVFLAMYISMMHCAISLSVFEEEK